MLPLAKAHGCASELRVSQVSPENAHDCLGAQSVSLHTCYRVVSAACSRVTDARCVPEYVVAGADMTPAVPPEVSPRLECLHPWHFHPFWAGQHLRAVLNKFLGMSTRAAGKFPLRRLTKVQPKPLSIVEVQHGKSCSKMNSGHPCFRSHGNHYCGFGVAAATA
jgi:hypothetical protein